MEENLPELFAVFFAGHYWNGLYNAADKLVKEGKFKTVREAYRHSLEMYQRAMCDQPTESQDHLRDTIKSLHAYCDKELGNSTTLITFVDLCAMYILPQDAYMSINKNYAKQLGILRGVISKTLARFTVYVLSKEISIITDAKQRGMEQHVRRAADEFQKFLQIEISELNALVIAKQTGVKQTDQVPKAVIDRLRSELQKSMEEKAQLIDKYNKMVQYAQVLKNSIAEKDRYIEELQKPKYYGRNARQGIGALVPGQPRNLVHTQDQAQIPVQSQPQPLVQNQPQVPVQSQSQPLVQNQPQVPMPDDSDLSELMDSSLVANI